MAIGPICYCPNCGAIFPSRHFTFDNSKGMTIRGSQEPCVKCRQTAQLLDGTFDFIDDSITLIKGPAFTVETLKKFKELAEAAQSGTISPDRLKAEAERLDPALIPLTNRAASSGKAGIAILAAIAGALLNQCNLNIDVDANKLYDQITRPSSSATKDS